MRLDHGFAETRITGWIPDVRHHHGLDRRRREPRDGSNSRTASVELLTVPGFRPHGERAASRSACDRDAGDAAPARGAAYGAPSRTASNAVIDLGGEACKPYVYAESVRAAIADLLHAPAGAAPRSRMPTRD